MESANVACIGEDVHIEAHAYDAFTLNLPVLIMDRAVQHAVLAAVAFADGEQLDHEPLAALLDRHINQALREYVCATRGT